jgi:hypothetical protein
MTSFSTSYLDDAGGPRLRESLVAFFDILGFSDASTSNSDAVTSQRTLDNIVAAIHDSRTFVRESFPDAEIAKPNHWAIKFFSDNLAFGYPFDDRAADAAMTTWFIVRCAQRYQLRMALNGYFLRGALTHGPICLTDEIIFGSALVECYRLESKASIVPRVLITEPLRELLLSAIPPERDTDSQAGDSICQDVDGWWFLNYLDSARDKNCINWSFVEQHKESILNCLATTTRHEVLPKFGWACRYHNVFCHWHRDSPGYADRFRIDRSDEHSTIHRAATV